MSPSNSNDSRLACWFRRSWIALSLTMVFSACSDEPIELGQYRYPDPLTAGCDTQAFDGGSGIINDAETDAGIRYNLRTPANYDPRFPHPLLIVFAAATHNRVATERFTKLTRTATAAGFVVVYPDHRRLSFKTFDELARIPAAVARHWCIDLKRVFLTGHSDGGTAAAAIAFRQQDVLTPAGIAPSAAGIREEDIQGFECPDRFPVMVMHNAEDRLFPDFGRSHANWWAKCLGCSSLHEPENIRGCIHYRDCDAPLRYCEGSGSHREWPARNDAIIDFFLKPDV